jgi:hypothetical protein
MEDQVPSSTIPQPQPGITAEQLAEMKRLALERAIQQHQSQQVSMGETRQPEIVYVRRNMTIAELILVLALSCGIVTGIQFAWNFSTDILSRIEIRAK